MEWSLDLNQNHETQTPILGWAQAEDASLAWSGAKIYKIGPSTMAPRAF